MHHKHWVTASNALTGLRFLLAPCIVILLYHSAWLWAFGAFGLASFTDLLDGYLARVLDQQTHLGRILDPLADKFLLLSVFGALTFFHSPLFHIPEWFFIFVLVREVVMLIGSGILLLFFSSATVAPTLSGKLTTMLQMLFLVWIFFCYFMGWMPQKTYAVLLICLAFLSSFSFFQYASRAFFDVRLR